MSYHTYSLYQNLCLNNHYIWEKIETMIKRIVESYLYKLLRYVISDYILCTKINSIKSMIEQTYAIIQKQ